MTSSNSILLRSLTLGDAGAGVQRSGTLNASTREVESVLKRGLQRALQLHNLRGHMRRVGRVGERYEGIVLRAAAKKRARSGVLGDA